MKKKNLSLNKSIAEREKTSLVENVFSSVASHYDLMNDLMSIGRHRSWKKAMIKCLSPQPGARILDVGGGTGDIALGVLKQAVNPGLEVIVADINLNMLTVGQNRALDRGVLEEISWVVADAESLPFPNKSVDIYVTAFCLRNVSRLDVALSEAFRVLKPGGRFMCLEFSRVQLPIFSFFYDAWSFKAIPRIGACVANDREAYEYLVKSIRQFPDQETFQEIIRAANFSYVRTKNLSGGIVAIHSGWRS